MQLEKVMKKMGSFKNPHKFMYSNQAPADDRARNGGNKVFLWLGNVCVVFHF